MGVGVDVLIEIGARQRDHKGAIGIGVPEGFDRGEATPGVQGDKHLAALSVVLFPDDDTMSELAEQARPAQGGDAVALARAGRGRSNQGDFHGEVARSKAGPDIPALRPVEVAPGVAKQAGSGRPAAAAQDLVGAEPGRGVFLVGVGDKARVWHEVAIGPLPDVANHLAAPVRAVAAGHVRNVHHAAGQTIEVGPFGCRRLVAPRETPPANAGRCQLPLGLRG